MTDGITKNEIESLSTAIERIVLQEVLEDKLLETLPNVDELSDSNIMYHGKVSVLFVDVRESTKLPEKYKPEQLIKIYRSYIRTVTQAVRYSGGEVRDFMGDGVLAVFIDNDCGKSEDKAVHAARYITTAIDKLLNPVLDKEIKYRISCGIGVNTGEISLSKVGMRGKDQEDDSKQEFGIAWIGNSTNLACKQSGTVECGTIFISDSTYIGLSDEAKNKIWRQVEILNGKITLKGYLAEKYYLTLDDDKEACIASRNTKIETVPEVINKKVEELIEKAKELGIKQNELDIKIKQLDEKEKDLNKKKEKLNEETYLFYCKILESGHCKKEYVKAMGKDFWEEHLSNAILAGGVIGKTENEVKQDVSYAMVSIYEDLELYDKAYDFLVEQAQGYAWLNLCTVQKIVNEVKCFNRLYDTICERLVENNIESRCREDFEKIKEWLESKTLL